MEGKRLNFNRPLLSVRRTVATRKNERCPSYRSELHSDPLRNPGTVPFVWEQIPGRPKEETKIQQKDSFEDSKKDDTDRENQTPQVTYGPNFLQFNDHDNEEDDGDFDFDYDEHGNMSFRFCGLLPHFCLKGSIGILNPTPGISVKARLPANPIGLASSSPSSQDARVVAYEPRSLVKHQKHPTVESNSQKLEEGHGNSDNLNESSPPLKNEVNIQKKGLVSFKELLAHENEKEADLEHPAVEKTLYVDKVHKVEPFKEDDVDIFGISHIPTKPFMFDLVPGNLKHDEEMITQTGVCNHPKVDQKVKVSQKPEPALPAPPPLPKSPSDSWLWRTLPSVNSKTTSLWSNHKLSSKTATEPVKNVQPRYPQGLLLPISET